MKNAALNAVYELAKKDPRVVFIGSDLGAGTLEQFRKEMPDRFFMEGVSEANLIGMAAGLAKEGFIPYVNTIGVFLTRRCYEQIVIDLCYENLPVRLLSSGGGLVYAPLGPTHMAVEDLAIMRVIPNMTVTAVCDADEMNRLIASTITIPGPVYIRIAKGGDKIVSSNENGFEVGEPIVMRTGDDILFISTGIMTQRALLAAELLAKENVNAGVVHFHTIKPINVNSLLSHAKKAKLIITLEEHTLLGGFGSAIVEMLLDHMDSLPKIKRVGLPDQFSSQHGSQEKILDAYDLTPEKICGVSKNMLSMI